MKSNYFNTKVFAECIETNFTVIQILIPNREFQISPTLSNYTGIFNELISQRLF